MFTAEVGLSSSNSSGAGGSGGAMGDLVVNGGGSRQSMTLYIVAGVVAVVGILMFVLWKKGAR